MWNSVRTASRALLLCATTLLTLQCNAQNRRVTGSNLNIWVSHWGDHRIAQRWSLHTEAHWRRAELGISWQQLLIRPAVNFHLDDQVLFTAGYSYYANYRYSDHPIPFNNWEHQLFEQVQLTHAIGRVRFQDRFRAEQRFIARITVDPEKQGEGILDGYTYQNRFRYRIWLTIPLGDHQKVGPGVFSANFYDEVFLNFGNSEQLDFIQQNRISALLGYQVSGPFSVLAGFLYQTIQRPGAANGADLIELNSTLHVALVYNLDFRKAVSGPIPGS